MGRKKINKRNIRKISKVAGGSSYAITLPIEAIRKFKWRERQKVVVDIDEKRVRLIVRDWKK